MSILGGIVGVLVFLYKLLVWALGILASALTGGVAAAGAVVLSSLWAAVIAVGLFASAVVLNLGGVENVYATLNTHLFDGEGSPDPPAGDDVPDVAPEAVTDDEGRFSKAAFEAATGMSPSEFIHLLVQANGGRVHQASLTRCLPWAKSTAGRYLDELESDGKVVRVSVSGRNVICTPEMGPEQPGK